MDHIAKVRPSSAHRIIGVYSIGVKFMLMNVRIGAKVEIPNYISENPNFVNPESSNNMCFWNCFAYHQINNKRCATLGKAEFEKFDTYKVPKE